jgi:nucleoside-diphosphate-sugar epimerase
MGTWKGGKEKAPAAMCRKVIESKSSIDVWNDGEQTRSFLYIEDCIDAVRLLMESDFMGPVNIGSEEMVTINNLAKTAMEVRGKIVEIVHIPGPLGVRGRNSHNRLIEEKLGWKPKYTLKDGITWTYNWIEEQVNNEV